MRINRSEKKGIKPEVHLIILWENARRAENEILQDIQENLTVLDCIEMKWDANQMADNFSRFYGLKLPKNSFKERECGVGPFLLLIVKDEQPVYKFVETSRGHEYVNYNVFNLKSKYREWTNGGHKIHTTNSVAETNHDLSLLMGINSTDYLKGGIVKWDGTIKKHYSNLIGANGWNNLSDLFQVLNNTIRYIVLRNHEELPHDFSTELHGDIDLLVSDFQEALLLLNAEMVFKEKNRVHCKTLVSNKYVYFDLRFLGDDYYCTLWEQNLLDNRELNSQNIFVPNKEDYFYSLIYHALIHKYKIADDYYKKIYDLFEELRLSRQYNIEEYGNPFDLYFILMMEHMKKNYYFFTKPVDNSVIYNTKLFDTETIFQYLKKNFLFDRVEATMCHRSFGSGFKYFRAEKNGEGYFVKWGNNDGLGATCKNEFLFSKKLHEANPNNFIMPAYYKYGADKNIVIYKYLEGKSLEQILQSKDSKNLDRKKLIAQLRRIANTLLDTCTIHRDIQPGNILVTSDNQIYLIDLQFCVDFNRYKEIQFVKDNPHYIQNLGEDFAYGKFLWDDMYSLHRVLEVIGFDNESHEEYKELSSFLTKNIGKQRIKFNVKHMIFNWRFNPANFHKSFLKFLYYKKTTRSGKQIIKVCKIPIFIIRREG